MGHPDFKAALCRLKSSSRMNTGFTQLSLTVTMTLKKRIQSRKRLDGCLA